MLVLFILLVSGIQNASGEINIDGTSYPSVPLPTSYKGGPKFNLSIDDVMFYEFSMYSDTYEPTVRKFKNYSAICLLGVTGGGDLYRVTDGRRDISDLDVLVVEVDPVTWYKMNRTGPISITYNETNWNVYYDSSPEWNILLSIPTTFSLISIVMGLYHLYLHFRFKIPFSNPHIALIIETIASFIRFLACLDFIGSRLLYPFWMARALITLYFPLSFCTASLITLYMGALLKNPSDTRTFLERKWLKIACLVVSLTLIAFEIITQIGIRITGNFSVMVIVTFCIYELIAILVTITFITGTIMVVRRMHIRMTKVDFTKNKKLASRSRTWLKNFLWRYLTSSLGYVIIAIGLTVTFAKFANLPLKQWVSVSMFAPLFVCIGFSLSSAIHIYSYKPNKYDSISSKTSKTSRTDETSRSRKSVRMSTVEPKSPHDSEKSSEN